ncbi:phosphate ABC transporter substrate-binding protein PstS [Promicromonospora sp. NPDC023805]|uniref:phosphate ABC transporter substrate-binding protein PstS n=1 Tax=Promicromonospora sp. NPDC023805 TaxID=3154696 RepID=UPI0033FE414A
MERHVKISRFPRVGSAVMVGALALSLAACGSDPTTGGTTTETEGGGEAISGDFAGAGASSQESAMEAWVAGFQGANPDVTIDYDPAGSGAGRDQFLAGGVAWAGSDSAMDDEELEKSTEICGPDGAIDLPIYVSPIAVTFNLPEIDSLNLSSEVIANIFKGEIKKWNDAAIAADNPDVELPDLAVTPVHRLDDSGTTENFTEYLSATAAEAWTDEPDGVWPLEGGDSAEGTSGVVGVVTETEGAVTYADASKVGTLGTAAIKVGEEWVTHSPEGAAAVVDNSDRVEGRSEHDFAIEVDRTLTDPATYPLVLVSYAIACTNYSDEATGNFVKAFLAYQASDEGQQAAAGAAGSSPISANTAEQVAAAIDSITVG